MRIIGKFAIAAAAASATLLTAPAANAGIIDGSLNNADVASGSNILGAMVNSQLDTSANNNSNTRP